jgi:hypothetical protein
MARATCITFGRFDGNNPQLLGPRLAIGKFYLSVRRAPKSVNQFRSAKLSLLLVTFCLIQTIWNWFPTR